MNRVAWIAAALIALSAIPGAFAAHVPSAVQPAETWTGVISVVQTPAWVTEQSAFTVNLEVADASEVANVSYTFCQLTSSLCYTHPVVMTSNGSNWFAGTSLPMTGYPGMLVGISAGYNISINYQNGTLIYEPSGSTSGFAGVEVAQSVTGENLFEVTVRNAVYTISGQVTEQATGNPVAGANVSLVGTGTNYTTSSSSGSYSFSNLLNGTYQLTVSKSGFHMNPETVKLRGKSTVQNAALTNASVPLPPPSSKTAPTVLGLPQAEAFGLIGGVVAIVVIVLALVLFTGRGRSKAPAVRESPSSGTERPEGPK